MSVLPAVLPETILSKVAPKIRFRVAEQALAHDKAAIASLLKKHPMYKTWGSKARPKQIEMLADHCLWDTAICHKVLQLWVSRNGQLKQQVWDDLTAAEYLPVLPNFQTREAELAFNTLKQEDILTIDDQQYFAPSGVMREEVLPEFYTLMAHVLGWSVLEATPDNTVETGTPIESMDESVPAAIAETENCDHPLTILMPIEETEEPVVSIAPQEASFDNDSPTAVWQDAAAHLQSEMVALATKYEAAAAALKQGEWPLPLLHQTEADLREAALELGRQVGLKAIDGEHATAPTVTWIHQRIDVLIQEYEARQQGEFQRQRVTELLHSISCVRHKTAPDFAPLQAVHEQAYSLLAELVAAPTLSLPFELALLEGTHPLAKFLDLIPQAAAYSSLSEDDERVLEAEDVLQELGGPGLRRAWQWGNLVIEPTTENLFLNDSVYAPLSVSPITSASPADSSETPLRVEDVHSIEQVDAKVSSFTRPNAPAQERLEETTPELIQLDNDLPVCSLSIPTVAKISGDSVADVTGESISEKASTHPVAVTELPHSDKEVSEKATVAETTQARPSASAIGRYQWKLLVQDDAALAFQLTRCAEELGWSTAEILPSWLLRSLILGPQIRTAYGRLADLLTDDGIHFDQTHLVEVLGEQDGSRHLLAWAAALKPTLLAPATTLNGWLSIGGVPNLPLTNELANRLAQRQSGLPLDESLLGAVQTQQQWDARHVEWQERLGEWIVQQEQAKFLQSQSNDIVKFWKSCLKEGRVVAHVLNGLQLAEPDHAALLAQLNVLRDKSGLREEVKRSKIDFSVHIQNNTLAQRWLDERVVGLADLVRQHLELWEQQPARAGHKDARHDDHIVLKFLQQQLPLVIQELTDAETSIEERPNLPWQVSVLRLKQAVEQLHKWLQHPAQGDAEALPRYWLGSPLLRLTTPELNADWEPLTYDIELWEQLWQLAQRESSPNWAALYEAASQASAEVPGADHQATARLLALAEAASDTSLGLQIDLGKDLQTLRFERAASLRQQPLELNRELDKVERELVRGQRYGYLGREAYERIQETLGQLRRINESHSDQIEDFTFNYRSHHSVLRELKIELDKIQQQAIEVRTAEVEQEVKGLSISASIEDLTKLRQALREGRLALVEDYLARLRAGRDLGPYGAPAAIPCIVKLRSYLQQLYSVQQQKAEAVISKALDLGTLVPDSLRQEGAAAAYEHWIEVKRSRTLVSANSRQSLQKLLEYIGFEVESIETPTPTDRTGRSQYLDLRTATLNERRLCPVGRFGSEAEGRYRVLSVWDTPDPADLSSLVVKHSNADKAVLVFMWEALPWKKREELGLHCRREGLKFLVFDELLLLYLLSFGSHSERLGLFFRLQLPFIHLNPYLVSGKIPSEMFYGRASEKAELVRHQTDGANLVYGGRQLGKTMLLHQTVREYHQPASGRHVVFLDIYHLGRDVRNLQRIGFELLQIFRAKKIGNWPASWSETITLRKVLDNLLGWLEEDNERTLLLLLDETDEFLEQDAANNFTIVNEFRSVMDKCQRRIKVVFSGLHNVQRTLNLPNQPLVQFGKPLNIGPLEPEQGVELIKTPLESLGFCFGTIDNTEEYRVSEALIDQIAVETNYYPSLMQIFCHRLMERLYERQKRVPTLLVNITEEDVQQASQNARSEINNRFGLTLDLNPRYRLLAYIIAEFTAQTTGSSTPRSGLLAEEVRELALDYWPEGWKSRNDGSYFSALLEEMVELRVLEKGIARHGKTHYQLRTANVRALLDSPDDIRRILADFDAESAEFAPNIVRAEFPTGSKKPQHYNFRGPLTVAEVRYFEEAGVSVICGTNAAGLSEVANFLSKRFRNNFEKLEGLTQFGPLEERLKELWADKKAETVQVVLVSGNCTNKWVDQTLIELRPGRNRKRPVHVVFEMDPDTLRRGLSDDITLEQLRERKANLLFLGPWLPTAVKLWLEKEAQTQPSWKKVADATGGWHRLLLEFFDLESKQHQPETHLQQITQAVQAGIFTDAFHVQLVRPFLRALAKEWGTKPFDLEAAQLNDPDNLSLDDLQRELKWAELLRLIQADKQEQFRFDPLVAKVLQHGA